MNGKWQYFLNSLATVGGNLFVLFICFVGMLGLVLYTLHDANSNVQIVATLTTTFGNFSGALLLCLKGRSTDTNPSPSGGTTSTSVVTQTTTPTTPPSTPAKP